MRAVFITLLLAATAVPGSHGQQPVPKLAGSGTTHRTADDSCNCGTAYRTLQYWKLHRPSTPGERAETGRLNREYLKTARASATPLPAPPDPAQIAYQQRLKNYRILTESYERRMRDYARLHGQDYVPPTEETRLQDSARLDPYRGYNSQSPNGY